MRLINPRFVFVNQIYNLNLWRVNVLSFWRLAVKTLADCRYVQRKCI